MDRTERPGQRKTTRAGLSLPEQNPAPYDLYLEGAAKALDYAKRLAGGGHFRFPWVDIDAVTGPLLPGWLVLFGARAKGGKSTFLRETFTSWVEAEKRVVFVGTEQDVGILRLLWACIRLGFPTDVAFSPKDPRHERVLEDVARGQGKLADTGILVADPGLTLESFREWARYAYRVKARALILDHFHRIKGEAGEEQAETIRAIKNIASASNILILAAAQLKHGEGGALGEYEVPGYGSWAGTANLHRECDLALQGWRPFRQGITAKDKQLAREDPDKLGDVLQPNTMAVRCVAHRYRKLDSSVARLYVNGDRLESWSYRTPLVAR